MDQDGTVSHVRRHSSGMDIIDVVTGNGNPKRSSQGDLPPSITPESLQNLYAVMKQKAIENGTYRGECPNPCPTDCAAYNPKGGINFCGRYYRVKNTGGEL